MSRGTLYWLASDWATSIQRSIRHTFRNADSLITSLMLPVVIVLLFVVVFGGAIATGTEYAYVNYIVPGVILTSVGYGSSTTAMIVNRDITGGIFDRLRTLPIARSSVLVGHVTGSLVRNTLSTILVFLVAFAVGFRPNASFVEWLAVIGLVILAILAISWISVFFGLLAKSVDTAASVSLLIMFLPYFSSAFVPVESLPSWLRGFAESQPITPIIDTLRGLLIGTPINNSAALSLLWLAGILGVAISAALILFRFKSRR